MRKVEAILYFCFLPFVLSGQITGTVVTDAGYPLSGASVYSVSQDKGSVTDSLGFFNIEGQSGDSIIIFHSDFGITRAAIEHNTQVFHIVSNSHILEEVNVSRDFAFKLLDKCRQNTYERLRNRYKSRALWKGAEIINNDTIQIVQLDLIIEQKKLKEIGKGARNKISKIQERNKEYNVEYPFPKRLDFQSKVEPFENNFLIYDDFREEYVCKIKENDNEILLYFFPIEKVEKGYNNLEVSIRKDQYLINYIASATALSKMKYGRQKTIFGNNILKNKCAYVYTEYKHNHKFSYLSYFSVSNYFDIDDSKGTITNILHQSDFQVYDPVLKEKSVIKKERVYDYNVMKNAKNEFQVKFLRNNFFKRDFIDYPFEKLSRMNEVLTDREKQDVEYLY